MFLQENEVPFLAYEEDNILEEQRRLEGSTLLLEWQRYAKKAMSHSEEKTYFLL